MIKKIFAFTVLAALAVPGLASADEGPFKGTMNAVGANCQKNSTFEIVATIVGAKVEGTFQGNTFKGPVKFSGDATATTFTATHVFTNLNNLKVEITGTKVDADTYTIATKWNGGGPNNCQSTGPAKKA